MLAVRQKLLNRTKQSATDAFKTASKGTIQKAAEATGYLIDNKIANKITRVSKHPQQNNSETNTNCLIKKYLKKDISLQKKRQ